jgi:TonB family protein
MASWVLVVLCRLHHGNGGTQIAHQVDESSVHFISIHGRCVMKNIGVSALNARSFELERMYHRNMGFALALSVAIHGLLVGSYYLLPHDATPIQIRPRGPVIVDPFWEPLQGMPTLPRDGSIDKPREGIPVPVKDDVPNVREALPTQTQTGQGVGVGDGSGGVEGGTAGTGGDEVGGELEFPDEPQPPWVEVEKFPEVVTSVKPVYPELALKAGLHGTVWVKVWVDKEGRPKEVHILSSENDIFNDAALEAARQFRFTPAYMSHGPVSVWVSLPFRFKIVQR